MSEIGKITSFGHESVDKERYLFCDGTPVLIMEYPELFAKIGTAFGSGDGITTFHLPDLRGRFLRGTDEGAGRDPDRAVRTASNPGGATGDALGSTQEDQFYRHTHNYIASHYRTDGDDANDRNMKDDYLPGRNTGAYGVGETRSKNVSVGFYIRCAR